MKNVRLSRWIVPALALAGFTAMVLTVAAGDRDFPVAAPLAEPAKSPFRETVSGSGLVEASTQNVAVASPLSGVVTRVYVDVGTRVQAGAPLFALDQRPLAAEIASREAGVRVAEARTAESEALLVEARDQAEKVRELDDPRAVSREEVMRRETLARAAESRSRLAHATLAQARAQLEQAQVDLERLTVRAPVSGEILQLNIRPGEFASPGSPQPPVVLGETRRLHVRVDIDESDAWRFRPGGKAVAYLRGNAAISVPASYVRTEPYVLPKRSLTGASAERVDTRVLQVIFGFDRDKLPIYVGQQMDVYVEAAALEAAARPVAGGS